MNKIEEKARELLERCLRRGWLKSNLCLYCKGSRALCGLKYCPLLKIYSNLLQIEIKDSNRIFGPSRQVFVGHRGWPLVSFGPFVALDSEFVSTHMLFGKGYDELVKLRTGLFWGIRKVHVEKRQEEQEIAMSKRPVDVEIEIKGKIRRNLKISYITQPLGPRAQAKRIEIADNPKIPRFVDKIVDERVKAEKAVFMLYLKGYDFDYVQGLFSSGALGHHKKIVPTRWAITACDDILARNLLKDVKRMDEIERIELYTIEYLGNRYAILLIPGKWEYEQFEAWQPGSFWSFALKRYEVTHEYEGFRGRSDYAEKQAGGYYAARFSVVEFLHRRKRQAKAIVVREITPRYVIPIGVWQVRESVRKALRKGAEYFDDLREALFKLSETISFPLSEILKKSRIINQKTLKDFI